MQRPILVKAGFLIACLVSGWALAQQAAPLPTVTLDRSVHFMAPDGSGVELQAGTYQVETAGESRLRLSPSDGGAPFIIEALSTAHTESLESPVALTVAGDEDRLDLVLLTPDKTALDAPGSLSGIRSRADLSQPLTAFQLSQTAGMSPKRMTSGVAPVALYPADGVVITGPAIAFKWFPGTGQSAHARYEICITELNHACSVPTAVVVKVPTGLLPEPPQSKQSAPFGPKPGDPDFERQVGTTTSSTTTYGYGATLPIQFQGKRLQWSVTACVPVTGQVAVGQIPTQIPESCASSAPKPITWTISPPILNAPFDNLVLTNLLPALSWTNGNQHGVEYFLVCIAKPNVPCPAQPGAQPHVLVTHVQNVAGFTPSQDLSPFMGHTLYWTVAACNTALGCFYQPQSRRLQVPIFDGFFDSIYPVTQNAKCKNCHQMHAENETYRRHIQLGRFTREEIPPSNVGGDVFVRGDGFINVDKWVNKCESCHTSATGFTNEWRAPHFRNSFDQPIDGSMCDEFKRPRGGINLQPPTQHMLHDENILWAVDRIPGLGRAIWQQKVNAWFTAGAPCGPTAGRRRGQFTP